MSWKTPFVVYRFSGDKQVTEIFECEDLQKAKYWIKYIAEPGDVLCRTPLSPKHSKSSDRAEYWCHKEQSGQAETNEERWKETLKQTWPDFQFPSKTGA
ncbi:MAG: hypothetical protein K1X83_02980 [Oligoflexia bacterium]|nr:hypothetical protein [Oligoflexia bacterium]